MEDKSVLLFPLLQNLQALKPVNNALEAALINSFRAESIKKGKVLLYEGEVCKNLWFLADGLLRSYHTIGKKEITGRIMFTNHIVIAPGSFFTQTRSTEAIEALSDCTVLTLTYTHLQEIYTRFPEFNYHTRIITEQYFYKQEQRLYMLRKEDPVAKYEYFMENYSDYLNHVPQKHIASFLGITRETFNRIRNKTPR